MNTGGIPWRTRIAIRGRRGHTATTVEKRRRSGYDDSRMACWCAAVPERARAAGSIDRGTTARPHLGADQPDGHRSRLHRLGRRQNARRVRLTSIRPRPPCSPELPGRTPAPAMPLRAGRRCGTARSAELRRSCRTRGGNSTWSPGRRAGPSRQRDRPEISHGQLKYREM